MTVRKLKSVAQRLEALVAQNRDLLKTLAIPRTDRLADGRTAYRRLPPRRRVARPCPMDRAGARRLRALCSGPFFKDTLHGPNPDTGTPSSAHDSQTLRA